MAFLLILVALFGFLGLGSGTSSSSVSGSASASALPREPWTTCVTVTWKRGEPAHERPCPEAPAPKP